MNLLKIVFLLTFGIHQQVHSEITSSLTEKDDCRMLIHVGCLEEKNQTAAFVGLSDSLKRAIMSNRSGFTQVELANENHKIYNYSCNQINETAPFGMFMFLEHSQEITCLTLYTRDSQKKVQKIPLVKQFNEAKDDAVGLFMKGPHRLCGPVMGIVLYKIANGEFGEPLVKCGVVQQ